jgi:purine-binding chemotaxis protein CheW
MTTNTAIAPEQTASLAGKYLSFMLLRESYGIPVLKVREIIRLVDITPIPQMPAFIRGVINLRGKIVPVMDLRLRLDLAGAEATERTCIVVVHVKLATGSGIHLGLVVDGVEEVMNLAAADIEETPEFGAKLDTKFLLGIAKVKGRVTALLDIDRVLAEAGLEAIKEAVAAR